MRKSWCKKLCFTLPDFSGARAVKRFQKSEDGVTAIEFSMVALPFFAILFAIIETGLQFFASQVMDNGFREAARLVRTGQAANMQFSSFRIETCRLMNQSSGLFNCGPINTRTFHISIMKLDDWTQAGATASVATNPTSGFFPNEDEGAFLTAAGCGNQIVLARAYYQWPSFVDILGSAINRIPNTTNVLLSSTAVFRNEPFGGC